MSGSLIVAGARTPPAPRHPAVRKSIDMQHCRDSETWLGLAPFRARRPAGWTWREP
jgi:hypothetical protein